MAAWAAIRSVILFTLGVVLIVDAVFGNGNIDRALELIVGLILIGVVPVDVLMGRIVGPRPDKQ